MATTNLYSSGEAGVLARRSQQLGYGVKATACYVSGGRPSDSFNQISKELGFQNAEISLDHHVEVGGNKNDLLFQGKDGVLYDMNFDEGVVSTKTEVELAKEVGMQTDTDKFYDILNIENNSVNFIDYVFSGTGDGSADTVTIQIAKEPTDLNLSGKLHWVSQEVDINAMGTTRSDAVGYVSNKAFQTICDHSSQWMTQADKNELSNCTDFLKQYNLLLSKILKAMDQTKTATVTTTETPKATGGTYAP